MARTEQIPHSGNAAASIHPKPTTRAYGSTKVCSSSQRRAEVIDWVNEGSVVINDSLETHITYFPKYEVTASRLQSIKDAIQELAELKEDWDDEGAPAINRSCLILAQKFIENLEYLITKYNSEECLCLPSVAPTKNGGLQLFWYPGEKQTAISFLPERTLIKVEDKSIGFPLMRRDVTLDEALVIAASVMRDSM